MYMLYVCLLAPLLQNGYALIGEETDLSSLSSYDAIDDLNENYEIWNTQTDNDDDGILIFESISKQLLESICENSNKLVYVTEEDITVDCKIYNQGDQAEVAHEIVKREAEDESELGGSGDGSIENPESDKEGEDENLNVAESDKDSHTEENNEHDTDVVDGGSTHETHQAVVEGPTGEEGETNNETTNTEVLDGGSTHETHQEVVDEQADKTEENETNNPTTESTESENQAVSEEPAPESDTNNETTHDEDTEESEVKETTPVISNEDVTVTTIPEDAETTTRSETDEATPPIEGETAEKQPESEDTVLDVTASTLEQEPQPETTPGVETTTIKNENPETTIIEETQENNPQEPNQNQITASEEPNNEVKKEHAGEEQKIRKPGEGRSVLNPPSKDSSNAAANDESVKTDESTQKAGSKDTTILIVLFAAVVLVGALAFAYNFVKKRKQRSRDLEQVERAPSIKRSLQNLTKLDEPEKKPLIGDIKEVEMVNMKKDGTAVKENGESVSNETTVKT